MAWIHLLAAGVLEWGWPIDRKFASTPNRSQFPSTGLIVAGIVGLRWTSRT